MPQAVTKSTVAAPIEATAKLGADEIGRLGLFKGANADEIAVLLQSCPVCSLATGDVLVRAGESCSALYLVLSGSLRAQDPSSTVPDTFIKAGDSLGELFLFEDAALAWTVSAMGPTRLLAIDASAAWTLVDSSHAVARNLLKLLVERARLGGTIAASGELRSSYKRHATLDESTGLHNRNWLDSILPRQVARSAMSKAPLSLLLIEIDDYGDYCAQFGGPAGDHARYAVAQTLINSVRPTDLVAGYGPTRFAVVLPDADIAGACQVGERLCHAVSEAVVLMSDESILPSVTVSIGAAPLGSSNNATALLKAGEMQLQTAKRTGGNRVCG
jgi:diguanylate cyclase (GGDEF)-like protein